MTKIHTSSLLVMRNDPYGWVNTKSNASAATIADTSAATRPPMIAPSKTGRTSASAKTAFGAWSRSGTSSPASTSAPSAPTAEPR